MVVAQIDNLELELRKLDGVRTVGFNNSQDTLYIQLFVNSKTSDKNLPFEATRIAKRYSGQNVAVELVRAIFSEATNSNAKFEGDMHDNSPSNPFATQSAVPSYSAGSIGVSKQDQNEAPAKEQTQEEHKPAVHADFFRPTGVTQETKNEEDLEINLSEEENKESSPIENKNAETTTPVSDRIELLMVSTSPENDEIEVHLDFKETRAIGRAPSNRGLLGAIDATVQAVGELCGVDEFHGEWARSLEPGAEHASLVAVGLINEEGNETRHGIAGGTSPIEAASRATLNALNRIASLSNN